MNNFLFEILGIVLALVGAGFLIGGGVVFVTRWQKWSHYQPTEGSVVDIRTESVTPGNPYYFPVVEFRLPSGKTMRFESKVGSYPRHPKKGDAVPVLYDPDRPRDAEIDSPSAKWFLPGGLAFLGIIALILGGMFWYLSQ